jgi:hypothetical protein
MEPFFPKQTASTAPCLPELVLDDNGKIIPQLWSHTSETNLITTPRLPGVPLDDKGNNSAIS